MKNKLLLLIAILCFPYNVSSFNVQRSTFNVKREFRGAWIQCVNGQFKGIGTETMQRTLTYQLNELQKDGCNAIIFQVRPECDALYESNLEPWSYYLTGVQGESRHGVARLDKSLSCKDQVTPSERSQSCHRAPS